MKRHIPMKTGDEYDYLTSWKDVMHKRAGQRKKIKRGFNRRERRELKRLNMDLPDEQ